MYFGEISWDSTDWKKEVTYNFAATVGAIG